MFLNENFSNVDALNELMGVKTFLHSLIKSGKNHDARIQNSIILEHLTPGLPKYQAEIVRALEAALVDGVGLYVKGKVVECPVAIIQDMVGKSSK